MSKFIWILLLGFSVFTTYGQEKKSDRLKKDQQELLKKISFTEKLLQSTKENQSNVTENLNLLERKIQYRQDLLNNLDIQLSQIDAQIANLQIDILKMEQQIIKHKEQYKLMIVQAYKMRNSHATLMFILSSESFNQANKRLEYIEQLKKYRQNQILKIQSAKAELEDLLEELEAKREQKKELQNVKSKEQNRYVNDREKQKQTIEELKGKEQQLQDELAQQKRQARELENQITAALDEEFRKAQKERNENPLTAEETKEIELNNKGFEANKGKLPKPVNGVITRGYGKQQHPIYSTVFVDNPGIDYTTVKGSTVRAVYKGEVTAVIPISGAGNAIIIKHGNYRTIYSNLQETYVRKGDQVTPRQEIGALLTTPDGKSILHFEIRVVDGKGGVTTINPTYWIVR
ncbi:MAG: peptidoglycan DD-metalloendopeptidase family protein [Crocinitomicaceae bacterium]|nr:peptidoglycan DD-metalloendopeptidase family protein [Crocinitomicaceae bacterium]